MKQSKRGSVRTWLLAGAVALIAALGLAACGSSGSGSSSSTTATQSEGSAKPETGAEKGSETAAVDTKAAKAAGFPDYDSFAPPKFKEPKPGTRIAFLMPETVVPLQRAIIEGVEAGAEKYGVDLTVFDAGGYANVPKQVSQFETAIGQGFEAIMMLPASPRALNAQIKAAKEAGITVTADLIPPESEELDFGLLSNSVVEAEVGTTELLEAIGREGEIFGLFGGEGSAPNIFYVQGAMKALKKFPKVKLVYEKNFPAFNPAEAQSAMEDGLAAHPNVDAVLTNSTSLVSGVERALQSAGLESVPTNGVGPNVKSEVEAIRSGEIVSATLPAFYRSGELITEWTLAIMAGVKPEAPVVELPFINLSPGNIDEAISTGVLYEGLTPKQLECGPGQSEEC
ncbi:MAG: sugar ABC transporter substrate-binding protein [Actinobacteria bacterium]|nr:sugar ABC transporter substrate-binding protein [Actinomycetota bacterium]